MLLLWRNLGDDLIKTKVVLGLCCFAARARAMTSAVLALHRWAAAWRRGLWYQAWKHETTPSCDIWRRICVWYVNASAGVRWMECGTGVVSKSSKRCAIWIGSSIFSRCVTCSSTWSRLSRSCVQHFNRKVRVWVQELVLDLGEGQWCQVLMSHAMIGKWLGPLRGTSGCSMRYLGFLEAWSECLCRANTKSIRDELPGWLNVGPSVDVHVLSARNLKSWINGPCGQIGWVLVDENPPAR